jgi:PTS system nitrogen regulatory IIA component
MEIQELITPQCIIPALRVTSKKQALEELAHHAARITHEKERTIFETLIERERLGTTGIGSGVAIPHGKLPGLKRIHGLFGRLERPIDFDAIDDQPVDLIFLLLASESAGTDHLKALARVSRLLRDTNKCEKLRGCDSAESLYGLLIDPPATHAA